MSNIFLKEICHTAQNAICLPLNGISLIYCPECGHQAFYETNFSPSNFVALQF